MPAILAITMFAFARPPHGASSRAVNRVTSKFAMRGYLPDGMSDEEYARVRERDAKPRKFDRVGISKYKSRSMKGTHWARGPTRALWSTPRCIPLTARAPHPRPLRACACAAFMESLENGTGKHLFAIDPKKPGVKQQDVPYMMRRGGKWDDSDIGKPKAWTASDKDAE
jgi:hypothetical protein